MEQYRHISARSNHLNKIQLMNKGSTKFATPTSACDGQTSSSNILSSADFVRNKDTFCRRSNYGDMTVPNNNFHKNSLVESESLPKGNESTAEMDKKKEFPMTRDEIVSRRKIKVAARKQIRKLEKQQVDFNEKDKVKPDEIQSFSLHLASEDFPTLDAVKTKKKINLSYPETFTSSELEASYAGSSPAVNEIKNTKIFEKSWKPKVKDPIHIDLSQALMNKREKNKPGHKKADPPNQRSILTGNILDSDNPIRRKGKVRPDKVQKPSKLKSHILHERKKKLLENITSNPVLSESLEPESKDDGNTEIVFTEDNVLDKTCDSNCKCTKYDGKSHVNQLIAREGEETCNKTNHNVILSNSASIHSRRFREYCTNCLTEEIITSVCSLLEKVAYFQDRMFVREPIKASAKRRYVAGINQVNKYLQVRKVKLLIIAPDLEKNPGEGGLDEKVEKFKLEAEAQGIPCVFGPNRKRLGKAVKKNTLVSCVAVINYEGADELYSLVLEALHESKTKYLGLTGYNSDQVSKEVEHSEESLVSTSDVTSTLLATLREELSPANRLLSAIHLSGAHPEE